LERFALSPARRRSATLGDVRTRFFAQQKARELSQKFDGDWWEPDQSLFADSLALDHQVPDDPDQTLGTAPITKLQSFFWINAIPMEADIALPKRATAAFPILESARFTDLDPSSGGFYQRGSAPAITGSFQASAVNTGVMAVAEANYGRMDLSLSYATFIAKELDLEQPGALPELFPSRDYTYFQPFDAGPWSCRPGHRTESSGRSSITTWVFDRIYRRAKSRLFRSCRARGPIFRLTT
jgi:hypothetical protein